jgi:hypothetical protein
MITNKKKINDRPSSDSPLVLHHLEINAHTSGRMGNVQQNILSSCYPDSGLKSDDWIPRALTKDFSYM